MRRSRFFSEKVPSYLCAVKGLHGKPEARISQREAVVKGMNCVLREGRTDNMGLFLIGALAGIALPSLDNIYCLSILFQVPIDAMVCGKAASVRMEHTDICTKRVFGYYKKIRNHAAA